MSREQWKNVTFSKAFYCLFIFLRHHCQTVMENLLRIPGSQILGTEIANVQCASEVIKSQVFPIREGAYVQLLDVYRLLLYFDNLIFKPHLSRKTKIEK